MSHIPTGDFLGGPYGTHSIKWSQAAPYLTWAMTDKHSATAISAVGIKTVFYSDPDRTLPGVAMYTNDESTFAHACNGQRVTIPYLSGDHYLSEYQMDVASPALHKLWSKVISKMMAAAHFDAVYEDDAGVAPTVISTPSPPCNYNDAAWLGAAAQMEGSVPLPVMFNGLSHYQYTKEDVSLNLALFTNPSTFAGDLEHCYATYVSTYKIGHWHWDAQENTELKTVNLGKTFGCEVRNLDDAETAADVRTYAYASLLLSYKPDQVILWENFATTSGLHVMPETSLIALQPVVPAPLDVSRLRINNGVYGREYRACYLATRYVAPCAVVVNPDLTTAYPWPYGNKYRHTLRLRGGGVIEGGTATADGPAPPAVVKPLGSAIAFR